MAADIRIHEICKDDGNEAAVVKRGQGNWVGANVQNTDWANKTAATIRFKRAINPTVDANNPIPIPNAGTNYSYEKVLCFYMEAPPDNNIQNFKFYTDGAIGWTGVTLHARVVAANWSANADATAIAQGYKIPLLTHDAGYANAATYVVGNQLSMVAGVAQIVAGYDNMYFGNFLYLQVGVGTTASAGTLAAETMTFAFDEA